MSVKEKPTSWTSRQGTGRWCAAHQIVEKNHGTEHLCLVGTKPVECPWHSGWAGTSPVWREWTSP